jgi:hypothetical protein
MCNLFSRGTARNECQKVTRKRRRNVVWDPFRLRYEGFRVLAVESAMADKGIFANGVNQETEPDAAIPPKNGRT